MLKRGEYVTNVKVCRDKTTDLIKIQIETSTKMYTPF